jgi:hypothetical protein
MIGPSVRLAIGTVRALDGLVKGQGVGDRADLRRLEERGVLRVRALDPALAHLLLFQGMELDRRGVAPSLRCQRLICTDQLMRFTAGGFQVPSATSFFGAGRQLVFLAVVR